MNTNMLFGFVVFAFLNAGCETLREYQADPCSYHGAYAKGLNDAGSGMPMRGSPGRSCDPAVQAEVGKGYREGYAEGNKNRPLKIDVRNQECHYNFGNKVCGSNCHQKFGSWVCD